jgi:selenocysteine-specific elongation factor
MLAGVSSVDVVLLVVAADEGVMPQTREHLNILSYLGVQKGLVALNKADLVDEDFLALVMDDLRETLKGSALEHAPLIPVSAVTGRGLEELRSALDAAVQETARKPLAIPARLPIDRVFVLHGMGTVATGTLVSGTIREGDEIELMPEGQTARVRQIQVHGEKRDEAQAGERVAVNLVGLKRDDFQRGDTIAAKKFLHSSLLLDARLRLLPGSRLMENWSRVRLAIATDEIIARTVLLDRKSLLPTEEGLVQFRLERPAAVVRGDRFVLRNYSPTYLWGGGVILDPGPLRHRRFDEATIAALRVKEKGDPRADLEQELLKGPVARDAFLARRRAEGMEAAGILDELIAAGAVVPLGPYLMHLHTLREVADKATAMLSVFHQRNPLKRGLLREELRSRLGLDAVLFEQLIPRLGGIAIDTNVARLASFSVQYDPRQAQIREAMEQAFSSAGINAPAPAELLASFEKDRKMAEEVLGSLVDAGILVKISEEVILHREAFEQVRAGVQKYIAEMRSMTVATFRDLFQTSRKYAIPILEYLDKIKFTVRKGDERVLKDRE